MKRFPTLFKRTATGGVQEWSIRVVAHANGTATIIKEQGLQGGKKQTYTDTIEEGKNLGRANATTAVQQALLEAEAEWTTKQKRKHYALRVADSETKREAAPMLALPYPKHMKKVDWATAFAQPKLDGHRCLIHRMDSKIIMVSREGLVITSTPHIADGVMGLIQDGETLDGELYCHGAALATISSWIKRNQPDSARLNFHLYDLVVDLPYADRCRVLAERMRQNSSEFIGSVLTRPVRTEQELMKFQAQCLDEGYEGAMLRWGNKGYEPGKRSDSLLKVKTFEDDEFLIVGVKQGRGSYAGMAVFTCHTAEGHPFDVTSPGKLEEKRAAWQNRDSYIGKWVTVKYQCYTETEKPVPFQPVAKAIRE